MGVNYLIMPLEIGYFSNCPVHLKLDHFSDKRCVYQRAFDFNAVNHQSCHFNERQGVLKRYKFMLSECKYDQKTNLVSYFWRMGYRS